MAQAVTVAVGDDGTVLFPREVAALLRRPSGTIWLAEEGADGTVRLLPEPALIVKEGCLIVGGSSDPSLTDLLEQVREERAQQLVSGIQP